MKWIKENKQKFIVWCEMFVDKCTNLFKTVIFFFPLSRWVKQNDICLLDENVIFLLFFFYVAGCRHSIQWDDKQTNLPSITTFHSIFLNQAPILYWHKHHLNEIISPAEVRKHNTQKKIFLIWIWCRHSSV